MLFHKVVFFIFFQKQESASLKTTSSETKPPKGSQESEIHGNLKIQDQDRQVDEEDINTDEVPETPERPKFPGHEYDFFTVYPDSQSDWVHFRLLTELERLQGLKGCTKERDFVAGRYVAENYTACIESSASVLMIITEDFCNDAYCHNSMMKCLVPNTKHPRQPRRIIPILVEDCKLPNELLLKTPFNATGKPSAPDWDSLVKAIEECAELSFGFEV